MSEDELERVAGYPIRVPNERPGRAFVEHLWDETYRRHT